MCFNAFGLGALNIYWIFTGLMFAILNLMPFSLDCTQAMPSWLGVEHTCNSIEAFLNLMWCLAIVGWGLVCAAVALLPKFVDVPANINKATMLAISAVSVGVNITYIVIAFTMKIEAEGATANLAGTLGAFNIIGLGFLIVALLVHREPNDNGGLIAL